jgi:hypothetical protein
MKTFKFILIFLFTLTSGVFYSQTENSENLTYEFDILKYRVQELDLQNKLMKETMMRSSQFNMKSAKQRNQSIAIGLIGGVVSSILITKDFTRGQTPVFGYVLLGGTAVATLSLQISSNNNQKKAGFELEKFSLGLK